MLTSNALKFGISPARRRRRQRRSRAELCESLIVASTCGLLLWAPLPAASNREWSAALLAVWAFLNVAVLISHRLLFKPISPDTAPTKALIALACVQLWVGIQLASNWSISVNDSLQYLLLGCTYTANFAVVSVLFRSRKRLKLIFALLLASATVQAFYGTIMVLSGVEWSFIDLKEHYLGVATGTFINRNHLAGYLEIGLGCGIALLFALRKEERLSLASLLDWLTGPKAIIRIALIVMVIGLVMTRSRMGNAAFFISLFSFGALFIIGNPEHRLRNALILASIILIDVLVVSQYFGLENLKSRIVATQFESELLADGVQRTETEQRDDVVRAAWENGRQHLVKGIGAGGFEKWFIEHKPAEIQSHWDHAHNDFIQFLIEFGLLPSLLLASVFIGALWRCVKLVLSSPSKFYTGAAMGLGISLCSLAMHSITDFNLQIPSNALTYTSILALAYVLGSKIDHTSNTRKATQ